MMHDPLSSQEIYRGKIVTLRIQTVPQPIGGTTRFEIVEHPDAVAIVAVRGDPLDATGGQPHVALVKQPRPAINRDTWEIPAGLVRPEERDRQHMTAQRELREETGYAADHWRLLSREFPSPGFSTEAISIFLATGLHRVEDTPIAAADPAYAEISAVVWKPLDEALAMCDRGEIDDGKTLLGLCLAQAILNGAAATTEGGTMYFDPTNPPNTLPSPPTVAAKPGTPASTHPEGIEPAPVLNLENMLLAEFNYASSTAYQAMEDRARTFNLYLVIFGVLASGLGALYQIGGTARAYTQLFAIALLVAAGIMGIAFFVQLIRLRQAYRGSLLAMNVVKEYYIKHFDEKVTDVTDAFAWRLKTIPPGERVGSVTFVVTSIVAMLASLCFGTAAIILTEVWLGVHGPSIFDLPQTALPYVSAIVVFLVSFALHIVYYRRSLSKRRDREAIRDAAKKHNIDLNEHGQGAK